MFQDFSDLTDPSLAKDRVAALRGLFDQFEIDGFLIPRADEYQNEYVPACAERLFHLTGFSGSAGISAVLREKAAIFIDGRYTTQARQQVDADLFEHKHLIEEPLESWLEQNLTQGMRLGIDPWVHTVDQVEKLKKFCRNKDCTLVECSTNLVDLIWQDRPAKPTQPAVLHPVKLAGKSSSEKITDICDKLKKNGANSVVLTQPDSICWLLNIRGSDVAHTPLVLAYAILRSDGTISLFSDPDKFDQQVREHLGKQVSLHTREDFEGALSKEHGKVQLDPATSAWRIFSILDQSGIDVARSVDPCTLPKAIKNDVEIEGARNAHLRDGVAVVKFLHWLENNALSGHTTEIDAAKKLEAFRTETGQLKEISFDTISAAGPHAAIAHYRVSETSNLPLKEGQIFLIDSGGQYPDGTTDITRTIMIGEPTTKIKRANTLVLKGHIAVSTARFPKGSNGAQLDAYARRALWDAGFDFDHGTGHGVGSFLSVHEGPQRISKTGTVSLMPGMILSNEPGYYEPEEFGIRIENLEVVSKAAPINGGNREMMGFETLTLAPFDKSVIEISLLTDQEVNWIDTYHARVLTEIGPLVEDDVRQWLEVATAPLLS